MNINISDYVVEMPDDTPVYKYISKDVFINYFFKHEGTIQFQKVSNWKDGNEGLIREFIDKCKGGNGIKNYLGCCFTLEQDIINNLSPPFSSSANNELAEFGSDAMWQIYCPNGGVRIKTTIGKIRSAISEIDKDIKFLKDSRVLYIPKNIPSSCIISNIDENALFVKRVSFRHEVEYRFVLSSNEYDTFQLPFNPFKFIDEFLVSPGDDEESKKVAKDIYEIINDEVEREIGYLFSKGDIDKKPEVRISQLYGYISQTI